MHAANIVRSKRLVLGVCILRLADATARSAAVCHRAMIESAWPVVVARSACIEQFSSILDN